MTRNQIVTVVAVLALTAAAARAADPPATPTPTPAAKDAAVPKPEQWITRHSLTIGGAAIDYTATAGTLIVRNGKDEPYASIGYVAYTKNGVADPARRPLTFAYNGGPGSSSVWLHMGVLGPRRIVTSDAADTPPPPYQVADNAASVLDVTDLVMIDPVGTGISKAVGDAKDKDFWGVDADIEEFARFIRQYVTENGRWGSPKYLLGESYGTTRSAGIVDALQSSYGMAFNGVVLVSVALDLGAIFDGIPANEQPYPLFLPSYAAVAWYHKALPNRTELAPLLAEVREFALGEYAHALLLGDALPAAERAAVIEKLHTYTGLSAGYIDKADLRVREGQFTKELLREYLVTVGRLDARFLGTSFDQLGETAEMDPMSTAVGGAFTAAFLDYYHRELKVATDRTYVLGAELWKSWNFSHKVGGADVPQPMVNTGPDLAHAIGSNPNLRVLILQGLYDLATPLLATEYTVAHLGLPPEARSRVAMKVYDAGHMMYIHEPALRQLKADVAAFIAATDRL